MKKLAKVLAMVLVMSLMLSLTAFAADDKPTIDPTPGPVTFTDETCTVMNVSFTNAAIQNGKDYMIWVIAATKDGEDTVYIPTQSSILYIGQATASGTTFTFNGVFPKEIADSAVMISGPGIEAIDTVDGCKDGLYTLATIKVPYKLGDVDLDGDITAADAVMLNKHLAGGDQLTGTNKLAADIDKDGDITAADAVRLNKYLAGGSTEV
jgi:hypothetical protein